MHPTESNSSNNQNMHNMSQSPQCLTEDFGTVPFKLKKKKDEKKAIRSKCCYVC